VFLKCSTRKKDGKEHRSWSVVESHRYSDGKVAQRHVLYLGEINDSQRLAWEHAITVFDESTGTAQQMVLFPSDRIPPAGGAAAVQIRLDSLRLECPRQWGRAGWPTSCGAPCAWMISLAPACRSTARAPTGRRYCVSSRFNRLLSPGSEWRLHRQVVRHDRVG